MIRRSDLVTLVGGALLVLASCNTTLGTDTTPDPFSFPAVSNAELATSVTSDAITVEGIDAPATIEVQGGDAVAHVDGAAVASGTEVDANAKVEVVMTSHAQYDTSVTATVTIGGVSADFVVTTKPEPAPEAPVIESFTANPDAFTWGGEDVDLAWTITGEYDAITLSSDHAPSYDDVTGTSGTTKTVPSDAPSVTYTLTAENAATGDVSATATIEIELWICSDDAVEVEVADPVIEEYLRNGQNLYPIPERALTCADMRYMDSFATDFTDATPEETPRAASLVGLQHAVNLEVVILQLNDIVDYTPLAKLTGLTELVLDKNFGTDLEPLRDLTNLEHLSLWDVGPERGAPANGTDGITDLEALSDMTALRELYLSENAITDIGPLSAMTQLEILYAMLNEIDDLSPVSGMTLLRALRLGANDVSDASVLANLDALVWLTLDYNLVEDVGSLGALENLWALDLSNNYLSAITPLADNLDFPAASGTGLGQEPAAEEVAVGYNCLEDADTEPGYDGDDVATIEGRGVEVLGFDVQREVCNPLALSASRTLRVQQYLDSVGR